MQGRTEMEMATSSITMTTGSSELRVRTRRALIHVLRLALIFFLVILACAIFGIRFNLTESLPQTVFIVTKDDSAPLVEFSPKVLLRNCQFSATTVAQESVRMAGVRC